MSRPSSFANAPEARELLGLSAHPHQAGSPKPCRTGALLAVVLALWTCAVLFPREAMAGESSTRSSMIRAFSARASDATNASFASAVLSGEEGNDPVRVTVVLTRATRTGPCAVVPPPSPACDALDPPVEVSYRTVTGSATPGSDFPQIPGVVLRWERREDGSKTFDVAIFDDNVVEKDETVRLELFNGVLTDGDGEVTLGGPSVLTIRDDDEADSLRAVAGNRQRGGLSEPLAQPLVAEVIDSEGQPLAGVPVLWRVIRGDASPASATTVSEADGLARLDVTLGETPGRIEVEATYEGGEPEIFVLTAVLEGGSLIATPLENQSPEVNDPPLELQVQAVDPAGNGLAGVPVSWQVTPEEVELSDTETVTDRAGFASTMVDVGAVPRDIQVTASNPGLNGSPVEFNLTVQLGTNLPPGNPRRSIGVVVDQICRSQDPRGLTSTCTAIAKLGTQDEKENALRQLSAEEAAGQGTAAVNLQAAQLQNVFKRLAALRGGAAAVSGEQIAFNLDGIQLTGEAFADLWSSGQPWELDLDRLLDQARGGAASADQPGAPAAADDVDDLGGRLGFFFNAVAGAGDQPQTDYEAGFDFEILGLTTGVDYRWTDSIIFGGALGFIATDADIVGDGGELDADGYSLSAYATYYRERYYLDGTLSYGRTEFESTRVIEFPGQPREIARGDSGGDQIGLTLGGGYDREIKSAVVGGFGRLSYVDADLDGYVERGAGGLSLRVGEQAVESLLASLGIDLSWAVSRDWGILQPSLRVAYLHEFEDSGRVIRANFVDFPEYPFIIPIDDPDRDYFNVGAGLSAVFAGGTSAFIAYEQDLARDDLDLYFFSAGLRLEL